MINIEDDEVTCNSYVVFAQIKKKDHFIYVDRHGNWVVGKFRVKYISMNHDSCEKKLQGSILQ